MTHNPVQNLILPPPVKKGETIGLICPAGPVVNQNYFTAGVALLNEMGFLVKFPRDLPTRSLGYLAGSDQYRAEQINELWADPEVKALLTVRGGYGSARILDRLNMELINNNPKILIGFSDITALHAALHQQANLLTFHGPVLTTLPRCDEQSIELFLKALTGRFPEKIIPPRLEILVSGNSQGRLVGGNLTTLIHLIATPYEVSWDNAILLIEDVGEPQYKLDRMLTHLKKAGRLDSLNGLILGSFTADLQEENRVNFSDDDVWPRLLELTDELDIPVWANFPVSHGHTNFTMPLGLEVEMDSETGTLRFLGPCVC